MNTVSDLMLSHPLATKLDRPLGELTAAFPGTENMGRLGEVLLQEFLRDRPQRFYDRNAYSEASALFDKVLPEHTDALASDLLDEVTEALRFLRLANIRAQDSERKSDDHLELRTHRLHSSVFALYSHLAEHVLGPLLALLIEISAQVSGRTCVVKHDLRTRWDMASSKRSGLHSCLSASYSPRIRNAIVHGGVTLGEDKVTFRDEHKKQRHLSYSEAERIAERLLDTCNGINAALVRALAVGSPMAIRLEHWSSTERAVTLARTPLLFPEAAYVTNQAGTLQAELHGVHQHWRYDDLIIDVARSIIAVRYAFPNATRCFVSFRTKNRTPCFFTVPHEQIPTLDAPVTEAGKLVSLLAAGDHGFAWLEHQRLLPAILGKTGIGRFLNWIEALDISTSSVEYELRELNDISVGWRSRFDAYIISRPRIEDLDNHARPTPAYLKSLFTETSLRWLLRPRSRPMGTKRIRFFDLGMIHVYLQDRRRTELRGSGLTDNLLFRAQIGVCTGPPFLGSSWEKIGQYHVTMNCRGHDILKQLKAKAG